MRNISLNSLIGKFRVVALLEGASYLMLSVTMILKYKYAIPEPNMVVGMSHGALFVLYVAMIFPVARKYSWDLLTVFWTFIASLLPFGTFVADAKIFSKYNSEAMKARSDS
jgi:integral membrane protein